MLLKPVQHVDLCDQRSSSIPRSAFCRVYLRSEFPLTHPQVSGGIAISLFSSLTMSSIFGPSVGVGIWTPSAQPKCTVWVGPAHGTDRAAGRLARSTTNMYRRSFIFRMRGKDGRRHVRENWRPGLLNIFQLVDAENKGSI